MAVFSFVLLFTLVLGSPNAVSAFTIPPNVVTGRFEQKNTTYRANQHKSICPGCIRTHHAWMSGIKTQRNDFNYSDDFFGLIFLSSSVLQDSAFATIFFVCSAVASLYANINKVKGGSLTPGLVALTSLGLVVLIRSFHLSFFQVDPPSALVGKAEVVVCLSSFAYGLIRNRRDQDENSG